MKADKDILEKVVYNINQSLYALNARVREKLRALLRARTVERAMALKKEILLLWLDSLPMDSEHCYFCMVYRCHSCPYARNHGICTHTDSDYYKIVGQLTQLYDCIKECYYRRGERYEEKQES